MNDPTYEAVLFDIGGVLLDLSSVRTGHERFLERFAARRGVEDVEQFVADWRAALGHYFSSRDGTGRRSVRRSTVIDRLSPPP